MVEHGVGRPDLTVKLFSRDQLTRAFQQQFEDAERLLAQFYSDTVFAQLAASPVRFERAEADHRLHWMCSHPRAPPIRGEV